MPADVNVVENDCVLESEKTKIRFTVNVSDPNEPLDISETCSALKLKYGDDGATVCVNPSTPGVALGVAVTTALRNGI